MVIEKDVASDTCFVVARAEENVAAVKGGVFIQCVAVIKRQLRATIVFVEPDVDHAGNRIRSVARRSGIFQNFNALNSRNGNGI